MSLPAPFVELGPGFWNIRGSFTALLGLVDVGTQMSICKLRNGRFLFLSTIPLNVEATAAIRTLTDDGKLIDAVIATHPFHTLHFNSFHEKFPNTRYYGTPRHMRNNTTIPWAGDISDPMVLAQWESEGVFMRIPEGAEFNAPEEGNHFSSVFVFHEDSRTIHDDDTLGMFDRPPGFILSLFGVKPGVVMTHPTTFKNGLYPTKEAPLQFKAFMEKLLLDWDFDNLALAHNGIKIGDGKAAVETCMAKVGPRLEELSQRNSNTEKG